MTKKASNGDDSEELSAKWTPELVKGLILIAQDENNKKGGSQQGGFTTQVWKAIQNKFNDHFQVKFSSVQLHSKWAWLKGKYNLFKALKDCSGFGWDDQKKIPAAPDEVWDKYLEAHPKAKESRHKTLQNFDELDDIFTGTIATGK